jgi:hypothetical protein
MIHMPFFDFRATLTVDAETTEAARSIAGAQCDAYEYSECCSLALDDADPVRIEDDSLAPPSRTQRSLSASQRQHTS